MSASKCSVKHTPWNPSTEEFNCPKCGAKCGDFIIDEPVEAAATADCELLHDEDYLVCTQCGYGCTGKEFARDEMKKRDLVTCPCCKGKGHVPSKVAQDMENDM